MSDVINLNTRGKTSRIPVVGGVVVVTKGRFLKTGEIFDEYWLQREMLPSYEVVVTELKSKKDKPDIFTFAQRVPDIDPTHSYYCELDNIAVLAVSNYDEWLSKIPSATRRNISAGMRRGIAVRAAAFDDSYVRGIMSIYNETPFRQGRRFRHFGKNFDAVRAENGTYAERSTFLAAFLDEQMVGYLKIVWDGRTAAIMQLLSRISVRSYRPNNVLMAEAVRQCCVQNVNYLLYEKFDYGDKIGDSLTKFKQNNGFIRMDVPRYYVPLTRMGVLALRLGLHRNLKEKIPYWIAAPLRDLRKRWYQRGVEHTDEARGRRAAR